MPVPNGIIGYDAAGQLSSDVLSNSSNAVLHQYYYNYDAAANRTSEQIDASVTQTGVNNLNQITAISAGGATRFQGTISEPGTVTVNGQAATMPTSTNFVANPTLHSGNNTNVVVATDGSGNAQTNKYLVVVPSGASVSPIYDAAGNMTNNGKGQTYQWDAENRLIQITQGSNTYAFAYDALGRVTGTSINGVGSGVSFDSLGRVSGASNPLGNFTYTYYGVTPRLQTVTNDQNGLNTSYSYQTGPNQDFRLTEIANYKDKADATVLSKFDYNYNPVGTIATEQEQTDSNSPTIWTYGYDKADQLTSATNSNTSPQAVISQYVYGYDPAGNRTTEQIGLGVTQTAYNNLNQIKSSAAGGPLQFSGTLSKPSQVTVGGTVATYANSYATNFAGSVPVTTGTTTVKIIAQDVNGNATTNKYQVVVPSGNSTNPTYDKNGNMLTNGAGQAYTWDAKNELTAIVYSSGTNSGNHTEMTYDGSGCRVKIVERTGTVLGYGTVTSTKQYLWVGNTIAEERDSSGTTVIKRFFDQGEQQSGTNYYYTRDHLGSVREMCDSSGTIQARYSYDSYGRQTKVSGSLDATFQYTGDYYHAASGLNLTQYRAYDPNTARWLSRDPLGEGSDATRYSYVWNNPINGIDPLGLAAIITYGNGTTATTSTASGFTSAANAAAANGGISDIDIDGHASAVTQTFGTSASDANAQGSQIALGPDGQAYLESSPLDPNKQLLSDVLKGKLNSGAKIHLDGCDAGAGNNNIGQAVSKGTGTTTYASPTPVLGRGNNGLSYAPAGWNVYVNGVNTGSVAGLGGM